MKKNKHRENMDANFFMCLLRTENFSAPSWSLDVASNGHDFFYIFLLFYFFNCTYPVVIRSNDQYNLKKLKRKVKKRRSLDVLLPTALVRPGTSYAFQAQERIWFQIWTNFNKCISLQFSFHEIHFLKQ